MTILVIKSVWKRKWPQPRITASVGLVVVGCLVAGIGDLTFDATAYAFAFGSVLVQALYLLLVEFQVGLHSWWVHVCCTDLVNHQCSST
jgi:solute carrier family 35 protein